MHTHGATLVGIDKFGNKYYEKLGAQFGKYLFSVSRSLRWLRNVLLSNFMLTNAVQEDTDL